MKDNPMLTTPSVTFRTNIDCCKLFMSSISGLTVERINPLVGDRIQVYRDSEFIVDMKVVDRYWTMTNGSELQLEVWLGLTGGWTIPGFAAMMRGRGFLSS